jgi:hypothetical protein
MNRQDIKASMYRHRSRMDRTVPVLLSEPSIEWKNLFASRYYFILYCNTYSRHTQLFLYFAYIRIDVQYLYIHIYYLFSFSLMEKLYSQLESFCVPNKENELENENDTNDALDSLHLSISFGHSYFMNTEVCVLRLSVTRAKLMHTQY